MSGRRELFPLSLAANFAVEGMCLLGEGVSCLTIEDESRSAGMKLGALEVADFLSIELLDRVLHLGSLVPALLSTTTRSGDIHIDHSHSHSHSHDHSHDHSKCCSGHSREHEHESRPPSFPEPAVYVLEKMAHGFQRLGRDHGGGFYEYDGDDKELWDGLAVFARGARGVPADDVKDRLLYIQALAGVRRMLERDAKSITEVDEASVRDSGFPAGLGGVISFINATGTSAFVERARQLAARYGARFEPPARLVALAERDAAIADNFR